MSDYKVSDTDLTAVANAIRTKGGTSASLSFPAEYVTAINNISGGGTGAISVVDTADAAGGTVRTITALDISDTTAAAGDVVSGKYFYTADGIKTQGSIATKTSSDLTANGLTVTAPAGHYASSASKTLTDANLTAGNIKKDISIFGVTGSYEGSGGGGLVYETGTYTPVSDAAQPTISFANSHSSKPFFVLIADTTGTAQSTNNSELYYANIDWYTAFGTNIKVGSSTYYARRQGGSKGSSSTMGATGNNESSDSTAYVSSANFKPSNGGSYYWRSGRTYKWIAVWAPTT